LCDARFAPVGARKTRDSAVYGGFGANLSATGATGRFAHPGFKRLGNLRLSGLRVRRVGANCEPGNLTKMSEIALFYGATIDKYVGDAIVIFFGDPETRGVKEDALACVEMAIAMRKRMRELQSVWAASGIEKPLQCRIGINTGYCTVGNFGSEDRMEYTIVGGGVNLASRLSTSWPR
jgi:hypothetical protein